MSKLVSIVFLSICAVIVVLSQISNASLLNFGGNPFGIPSKEDGPCSVQFPPLSGISCMTYFDEWFFENGNCIQRGYSGCQSVGGFQTQSDCIRTCTA